MKIRLSLILIISFFAIEVINFIYISKYNLFIFYLFSIVIPSILYSISITLILREFKKNTLIFYYLFAVIHLLYNWLSMHLLLTKDVFNKLVENTMKINPEIGNNISLDLSLSSFIMISVFVLLLIIVENYILNKTGDSYVSKR